MQLKPGAAVHLLGIGGVGMSALAHLAHARGLRVSGSDARESPRLARLREAGVDARCPHAAIPPACELVAHSPALAPAHPQLSEARARGLPLVPRAGLLAALLPAETRVAVAGTHGKSTTTAMLAHVLLSAGRDPSVILGAHAPALGGGHRLGREALALFEACEGYGALDLTPAPWACVTNIDDDHLEQYASFDEIVASFARLCCAATRGLALGVDDPRLRAWASEAARPWTFALEHPARVQGQRSGASSCALRVEGRRLGELRLPCPGAHNLRNALAAIACACMLELDPREALRALASFEPVGRRLEPLGEVGGALLFDDYAHHPSEVAAAVEALRSQWPGRRLIAVFQPHLPSRERRLRARFAAALSEADRVIVTPTYAAREPERSARPSPLPLTAALRELAHDARDARSLDEAEALVRAQLRPGDLVLVMGAGDIGRVAQALRAS